MPFFRGLHPFRGETSCWDGRFLRATLRLVGDRVLFDMRHQAQPSRSSSQSFQPVAPGPCCFVPNTKSNLVLVSPKGAIDTCAAAVRRLESRLVVFVIQGQRASARLDLDVHRNSLSVVWLLSSLWFCFSVVVWWIVVDALSATPRHSHKTCKTSLGFSQEGHGYSCRLEPLTVVTFSSELSHDVRGKNVPCVRLVSHPRLLAYGPLCTVDVLPGPTGAMTIQAG